MGVPEILQVLPLRFTTSPAGSVGVDEQPVAGPPDVAEAFRLCGIGTFKGSVTFLRPTGNAQLALKAAAKDPPVHNKRVSIPNFLLSFILKSSRPFFGITHDYAMQYTAPSLFMTQESDLMMYQFGEKSLQTEAIPKKQVWLRGGNGASDGT